MTKNDLNNILKSHVANISFTKLNGDVRDMKCTTDFDALRDHSAKTNYVSPMGVRASAIEGREDMMLVWDLEAEGWRTVNLADVEVHGKTPTAEYFA